MIHDQFLTHSVNIIRLNSSIAENASLPLSTTINATYEDEAVVKIKVLPAGTTSSFLISGSYGGAGQTESITFDGSVINTRISNKSWDGITSITSTGGNSSTVTINILTAGGQPMDTKSTVYSAAKCRLSHNFSGRLVLNFSAQSEDKSQMFTILGINTIKVNDEVVDLDSGKVYTVVDVDEIYDYTDYHHTQSVVRLK